MIKVTKFENNGARVLMKDNGVKVEFVDGVIKIYDEKGKKVVKTLKSEKTMKKYVEVIENYKAKKGLNVEQQKLDVEEAQKEEVKKSSVESYIEKKAEEKKDVAVVVEEKREEKKDVAVVVEEKKDKDWQKEFFQNINGIPLTTKTMVIDATCKAHKEVVDGMTNRFTRFTIFLTTDNKELNDGLINCLVENMEKNLENGFGYGFKFDRETLRTYPRGEDVCHEMTLTIPLTSGMSEIRKNVCTCYYASKKNIQAFYKEVKAWKMRQKQGATNTKKKSSKKEDNKSV